MKINFLSGMALSLAITAMATPLPANAQDRRDTTCIKPSCITYLQGLHAELKEFPNEPFVLMRLSRAYRQEGDIPKALEYLDTYMDLQPTDVNTMLEAARLALTLPDFALAEKFFQRALAASPKPALVHNEMGAMYLKQDLPQQAVQAYETAIRGGIDLPDTTANLGVAYLKTDDLQKAITHLHKAARQQPGNADRQNMLGLAYMRTRQHEAAAKAFKKAIQLKPGNIVYHYNLGEAYRLQGLSTQALTEYDNALQNTPSTADEFFNQGKVGYRLGLYEDALKKYTVALEKFHEPVHKAQVYMAMGLAYEALENIPQARQMYQRYLELIPKGDTSDQLRVRLKSLQAGVAPR